MTLIKVRTNGKTSFILNRIVVIIKEKKPVLPKLIIN